MKHPLRLYREAVWRPVNCFRLPPEQLIVYGNSPSSMIRTTARSFRIGMMITRTDVRRFLVSLLTICSVLLPTIAQAAIAIDASTPALVALDSTSVTSAAFNPPDSSLLLVCVLSDSLNDEDVTITITNNGAALTWTEIVSRDGFESSISDGNAAAAYALLTTGRTGMTVSATSNSSKLAKAIKVYVITGHDTSSPIGASGEGDSNTNNITPTIYTSTVNNSRGFGCADDWNALGSPTSTDTEDPFHLSGLISGLAVNKASDTTPSGTAVTMNFDAFGTSAAQWNWVGVEVKPAASVGGTPAKRRRHFFWFLDW